MHAFQDGGHAFLFANTFHFRCVFQNGGSRLFSKHFSLLLGWIFRSTFHALFARVARYRPHNFHLLRWSIVTTFGTLDNRRPIRPLRFTVPRVVDSSKQPHHFHAVTRPRETPSGISDFRILCSSRRSRQFRFRRFIRIERIKCWGHFPTKLT